MHHLQSSKIQRQAKTWQLILKRALPPFFIASTRRDYEFVTSFLRPLMALAVPLIQGGNDEIFVKVEVEEKRVKADS